jgi:hypothetical protein
MKLLGLGGIRRGSGGTGAALSCVDRGIAHGGSLPHLGWINILAYIDYIALNYTNSTSLIYKEWKL